MEPAASLPRDERIAYFLSAAIGAGLWIAASALSGKREAWDSGVYWSFAYPVSLVVAGAIAWFFPRRAWRWSLAVFLGQFVGMAIRNGEIGNLAPLGMIVFGVLSLPGMAVGSLIARLITGSKGQ